jgi:hypothetical protein
MIFISEILEMIFSYLYYPIFYPKYLLSCALVSKSWCNNALPFLWSKPFIYNDINNDDKEKKLYNNNNHIKQVQQFRIFLSFLPDQLLNQIGLKKYSLIKINYNYLSFIEEFYYLKLYEACLEFWKDINNGIDNRIDNRIDMNDGIDSGIYMNDGIDMNDINMNYYYQECTLCTLCNSNPFINHPSKYFLQTKILPIIIELFNLIILNSKIKYFEFSIPKKKCFCDYIPLNYFTISSSSSSHLTFSTLQSFKCNGKYNFPYKELFTELIKYSKNISEIKLENFESLDNLDYIKKLIVSQRNLRNVELDFLIKQDFSDLFVSLKGNSNLSYVKLSYCLFNKILPIKILSSCNNLKELIIESSEIGYNDYSIDSIGSSNSSINSINSINSIGSFINSIHDFNKLKSLKIIKSILPKDIFNHLFSRDSNLEILIIKEMDLLIKYSNIIPLISLNCHQLKFLEIGLTEYTFEKILEILEYCNKLQDLIIYDEHHEIDDDDDDNYYYNNYYYNYISKDHLSIGQVFKKISKFNLKKLFITTYYYFSEDDFKEFLFNYNEKILKHLSINICGDKLNTFNLLKDYSKVINKDLIINQWNTKNYDGRNERFHQLFSVEFMEKNC